MGGQCDKLICINLNQEKESVFILPEEKANEEIKCNDVKAKAYEAIECNDVRNVRNKISLDHLFNEDFAQKNHKRKTDKSIFNIPLRPKSNPPIKKNINKFKSKSNEKIEEIQNELSKTEKKDKSSKSLNVRRKNYYKKDSSNSSNIFSIPSRVSRNSKCSKPTRNSENLKYSNLSILDENQVGSKTISSDMKKKKGEKMIKKLHEFRKKNLIGDDLIEMDFAVEIFIQINTLRNNCLAYTKKIDFFSKFIEEINGDKFLTLEMNDFISNSILVQGLPSFKEAIKFLEIYYKKYSTLNRLVHISDLKIPFPNDVKLVIDKNYIHNKAEEIKKKFKGKYEVTGYTYDITYKDAELTTIMQIVDDNYGNKNRRHNLLNKDIKYIGINYKKLNDEQYAVYILLAK
jgi:hypothetical protein